MDYTGLLTNQQQVQPGGRVSQGQSQQNLHLTQNTGSQHMEGKTGMSEAEEKIQFTILKFEKQDTVLSVCLISA